MVVAEQREHRPAGIFDVRDHYRERQVADGLAATVTGPVRLRVGVVVTPAGRVEPHDWLLDTRRTLSGLLVFLGRVVEGTRSRVLRTLPPSATSLELRVSSPRFQSREVNFTLDQPYTRLDLFPGINYAFSSLARRPDEAGPTLVRGSLLDEHFRGIPAADVAVTEGLYTYRTEADGGFVIVLPDSLPWVPGAPDTLDIEVSVTLTPGGTWQSATPLPEPGGPSPWARDGLVLTTIVKALRGGTAKAPPLRLRLS